MLTMSIKIFSAAPLRYVWIHFALMQIILLLTMLLKYQTSWILSWTECYNSPLLQYYYITCKKNSDHKSLRNLTWKKSYWHVKMRKYFLNAILNYVLKVRYYIIHCIIIFFKAQSYHSLNKTQYYVIKKCIRKAIRRLSSTVVCCTYILNIKKYVLQYYSIISFDRLLKNYLIIIIWRRRKLPLNFKYLL